METEILDQQTPEASALATITKAEIDIQISTAKTYPRVLSKVKSRMLSFATLDEETAQGCFYTLPRGSKTIQGPSVRLAEIAASCYGNLKAGTRPIQTVTTGDSPHVIIQAVAFDIENNTSISIEKRGRIFKKKDRNGGFRPIDEDDINLAVNRCSAIALRDAIFKVVPLALVKPVFEEAKRVAVGDVKSLVAKREKVVSKLKQMGATEERILAAVEAHKIDDITIEKLEVLIGLGTALKDGETTLEEAFPIAAVTTKAPTSEQSKSETKQSPPVQGAEAAADTGKDAPARTEGATPSTGATSQPQAHTPQDRLMELVKAEGYSFAELVEWAVKSGNLDNPVNSPEEIPASSAETWIKAKRGLVQGLAQLRKEAN
jgi:hypothetical protein